MTGLTESFQELLSKIGDSDLEICIDSLGFSNTREAMSVDLRLSVGCIDWKLGFVNEDKDRIQAEELFLPKFRKTVMTTIGHKGITVKEYERVAASQIRKPELEPWKLMERRIRSTFHTWMTGSGLVKAISEHHRQKLKRVFQAQFLPMVEGLTKQEILAVVGEVYDENLVREVIES
jgi:hypothetical protein